MEALIKKESILTNVKQMLRLRNTDNDRWLKSLISQGARDLNSPETLVIENCDITVTNNKFYMPDNCKTLLMFRCHNSCLTGVFVDIPFLNHCGCNNSSQNRFGNLRNVVKINGRWVNFINTVPDGEVIEIAYSVVDTDEEGDIIINEEAYTHLSMYAAFWFAASYPENYDRNSIARWEKHSSLQGGRVRSAAAWRKFQQQRVQIANLMYTVVQGASLNRLSGQYSFWINTHG